MTTIAEIELETELQEVYMQAAHWMHDISFLETETHFLRNIIARYQPEGEAGSKAVEFITKITEQERSLNDLKTKIPVFLAFLEPFIGDLKKEMDLEFLDRYNVLQTELNTLFETIRGTKAELFRYTEALMATV